MKLKLKVVPGSSRDAIGEWMGDILKVKVQAPPEKGRANKAVEKLLARRLGIAPAGVKVIIGHTHPNKVVEIASLTAGQVRTMLGGPPDEQAN